MSATIRQQIVADSEVRNLINRLVTLPEEIAKQREALSNAELELHYFTAVDDAKQALKDLETEVGYEVLNDVNGDGKKKFTNAEQREAETRRRMIAEPEYQTRFAAAHKTLHDAYAQERQLKWTVGKTSNSLKHLVDLSYTLRTVGEIIAGLCHEQQTAESLAKIEAIRAVITKEFGSHG